VGGKAMLFRFKFNVFNEEVKVEVVEDDPNYLAIIPGFNFYGLCNNELCEASN
jgi:hypothetical protein